jgi:methylamine dehydrogenase heavy chain
VDVSGPQPRPGARWSLFDDADREDDWRIGGRQILAVHHATGRLWVLVHQGPPDTHKEGGSELWSYDLATRERVDRIALRTPGLTYLGVPLEFGQGWIWPFDRLYDWLVGLADLGVGNVAVTQGEEPLLVTGSEFSGSLALYDATTGRFLRRTATGNTTNLFLQVPWQGAP